MDEIETIQNDPTLTDTQKAIRITAILSQQTLTKMQEFCEKWDREHQDKKRVTDAAKRAVKQFLKGIGWLD